MTLRCRSLGFGFSFVLLCTVLSHHFSQSWLFLEQGRDGVRERRGDRERERHRDRQRQRRDGVGAGMEKGFLAWHKGHGRVSPKFITDAMDSFHHTKIIIPNCHLHRKKVNEIFVFVS